MEIFFTGLLVGLILIMVAMFYRVFKGPSVYDRLNGLSIIGIDTILLLLLFGYLDRRPDMYVDIALAYAMLGFISMVVLAKYILRKETG